MKKWVITLLMGIAVVIAIRLGDLCGTTYRGRIDCMCSMWGRGFHLVELGDDRQLLIDGGPDATVLSNLELFCLPGTAPSARRSRIRMLITRWD